MKAHLKDGFEVDIRDEAIGDWEFLEILSDIDEGETGLIVRAARTMLGKEGVSSLKEHIRDGNGRVDAEAMVNAIQELMNSTNESKNS